MKKLLYTSALYLTHETGYFAPGSQTQSHQMKLRITTLAGFVLALLLVGDAFAQVPSSVTQQMRLSTGGATPNYVQHRAITSVGAAPTPANAWYAWDQVPAVATGVNYLLMLNDANEVVRTNQFSSAVANYFVTVDPTGNNLTYLNPADMLVAQNGLTENGQDTIELGGTLLHNTEIAMEGFNMVWRNTTGASEFRIGDGTNTLNVNIDPGGAGNLNLQNIDNDDTLSTFLAIDLTGNVRTRTLASLVDADNGLTAAVVGGTSVVSLGSTGTGLAPLLTNRFVSLGGFDLNWEGTGNFNLGDATSNVTTNIHTGTTGNVTLQGSTLDAVTNVTNFLYTDGNNVRRATAQDIDTNATPVMYMAVDAAGNIVQAPSPTAGIYRGQIAGNGSFTYTSPAIADLQAGASINCTVYNTTGVLGTVSVQVTGVTAGTPGTFTVETSESIQTGSFINYMVMNP
jgi:hypothetical protein